jgi:tmRNA-binding protein
MQSIATKLKLTDKDISTLYLEYVNDFLTVESFAFYHKIGRRKAINIINRGKQLNDK